MGNAPLPKPPAPTERRVVVPIATAPGWFATRLLIHSPLPADGSTESESISRSHSDQGPAGAAVPDLESPEPNDGPSENGDNPNSAEEQWQRSHSCAQNVGQFPFPKQLQIPRPSAAPVDDANGNACYYCIISPQEYQTRLAELQIRLDHWTAGKLTLVMLLFSIAAVLVFIILLAVPTGFLWYETPMVDHPFYMLAMGIGLVAIYAGSFHYIRRQSFLLVEDTEDIFRSWRRPTRPMTVHSVLITEGSVDVPTGVHVTLKRVSHVDIVVPKGDSKENSTTTRRIETNSFCLIMNLVDGDPMVASNTTSGNALQQGRRRRIQGEPDPTAAAEDDVVSLGTCNTDGSDEGNIELG